MHHAMKVVFITERSILEQLAAVIEKHGATGYTHVAAGGKGSRGKRTIDRSPQVAGIFANVKIEVIVSDRATAEALTDEVAAAFFEDYSGITYVEPVEILRPAKFKV